jgi:hypothetical protein
MIRINNQIVVSANKESVYVEGRTHDEEPFPKHDFGIRKMELVELITGNLGPGRKATSSVTMVKTPTSTVVVDSGSKHMREVLVNNMRSAEAKVEKVNVLVTSKVNELTTGNDDLFVHCLQHISEVEWGKVPNKSNRKVAISTPFHWIDKYLKIVSLPFPEDGSIALLVHFPKKDDLLEPSTVPYAGKVVGIAGVSVPSESDPIIAKSLESIRKGDPIEADTDTLKGFLSYCDLIIPAYGPKFEVRR